ncbi:MAG TPA: hypothetical protein VFB12_09080, partial [Ktedonobacteraceae bacterium]|nr:hypothetical protein [Ktedonobacteraceae bacterium]
MPVPRPSAINWRRLYLVMTLSPYPILNTHIMCHPEFFECPSPIIAIGLTGKSFVSKPAVRQVLKQMIFP